MSEVELGVYAVYFDDEDGIVEFIRVTAEDEHDAEDQARVMCYMPNGVREVEFLWKA